MKLNKHSTKEDIRKAYRGWNVSYEEALAMLEALGMSEGQADHWLWDGYHGEKVE